MPKGLDAEFSTSEANSLERFNGMKLFRYFLIFSLVMGCAPTSELIEDIFMPNYRRILDGNRAFYYMHPTKPNKLLDKKMIRDDRLVQSALG